MEILHDNFPACPDGNDELTKILHYPSVVIIYLALALVSIIFAILTGVKYNSITVAKNRKISAEKISNVAWIAYYVIVACMSLVQAAEYIFEENYWASLYLYVAGRIFHGGTVLCLSFALNHQRKYRTYSATKNINNGEQQPLITHPQASEEPKTWGSLLVSIEGFLIVLFIIYMAALYLEMFTSSTETEQTFWIIFICVFVAQRVPLAVMAVTIVFNCKADGPTTRSRVLLIIAAILYFVNDLPASIWGKLYEYAPGCVFVVGSIVDLVHLLYLVSQIFFFLFLRSEYLRNAEECVWETVSANEGKALRFNFAFRRFN
jgi:hypothetical protein